MSTAFWPVFDEAQPAFASHTCRHAASPLFLYALNAASLVSPFGAFADSSQY